jgi:hypothetical protein
MSEGENVPMAKLETLELDMQRPCALHPVNDKTKWSTL